MEVESLVQDLAAIGIVVDDVYELVNSGARYDAAVPVLAKWLPRATGFNEQERIARSLWVPWANSAAPALIDQFKRAQFVDPVLACNPRIADVLLSLLDDEDALDSVLRCLIKRLTSVQEKFLGAS